MEFEKQVFELFQQMNERIEKGFNNMNNRFDKIEKKLDGIGEQIELVNGQRIEQTDNVETDFNFISDKVNKLEKEIFIIKHGSW
jgi:predicted nuclease with TOPRIM domain